MVVGGKEAKKDERKGGRIHQWGPRGAVGRCHVDKRRLIEANERKQKREERDEEPSRKLSNVAQPSRCWQRREEGSRDGECQLQQPLLGREKKRKQAREGA